MSSTMAAEISALTLQSRLQLLRKSSRAGTTRPLAWRRQQLAGLRKMLKECEEQLIAAVYADFRKPRLEAFATELSASLAEIDLAQKNIAAWMRPEHHTVPLFAQPGHGEVVPQPKGVVLIMSPWNYPILLSIGPLVSAIAAGNCVMLKPSELSQHTSSVLAELLPKYLDPSCIQVMEGGPDVASTLLAEKFDHIFFTGSARVGRIVMTAAARHLTPVTLELGGKCPAVVLEDANLDVAARRIIWGKLVNVGQSCVAPDYVLAHASIHDALLEKMKTTLHQFYGQDPQQSPDFGRIINQGHFERIEKLLADGQTVTGGTPDAKERYIPPTILRDVPSDAPIMQEEIFGPVLPVLPIENADAGIDFINARPSPLALYFFTGSKKLQRHVVSTTRAGSICFNDVVVHFGIATMPFGGVGESGMGSAHGYTGFTTFSHMQPVLTRWRGIDPPLRYAPYSEAQLKILGRII